MNEKRRKFIALSAEKLVHEMKKKSRESIKVVKQEPKQRAMDNECGSKRPIMFSIKAGIDEKERKDHRLEFFVNRDHQPIFIFIAEPVYISLVFLPVFV